METSNKRQSKDDLCLVHESDDNIKSEVGKAALKVIGPSTLITQFDESYRLHEFVPTEKKYRSKYETKKSGLVKKLKIFRDSAIKWLSAWEKKYFLDTVKEPTIDDVTNDPLASIVRDKKVLTDRILKKLGCR